MSGADIAAITPRSSPAEVARAFSLPAAERGDDGWWNWPNVIAGFQQAVHDRLAGVTPFPRPPGERGIVIVGGGHYLPSVYVTVRVLRHVGCRLPIEVWHFPGEDDPRFAEAIREYGAEFKSTGEIAAGRSFRFLHWHWWRGWQLKAFALLHAGFREVLLLDADCYPNRNPEYLFDWPPFRDLGAVFWPDVSHPPITPSSAALDLFEIVRPRGRLAESGQLLLNREASWQPLQLAGLYNECADLTYRHVWGDKDTFPFAWQRCGRPFARMWPVCLWEADCLLQLDYDGHVIFQHRVGDKFKLEPSQFASTRQAWSKNRYHELLAHESFCFHALGELRLRVGA